MKRRRGNKIFKKINNIKYLPILSVFLILGLSIGFSAFQETLLVEDMVANVTLVQNAQVTAAQLSSVTNHAESNYVEVTDNTLSGNVKLPEETSTVTYKVEFKNLENVEVGILDITSDNDDIKVISTGVYTLGDKVCDDTTPSKCTLGATKYLYITVGYSENAYDVQTKDDSKDFTLSFDVRDFVSVTYVGISGSGYPTEVINGGTFEVDFDTNAPSGVAITMDSVALTSQEYTYTSGILTIPNVDGDIVISAANPGPVIVAKSFGACTYTDNDTSGGISTGDKVTCGTEGFYVIKTPSDGVVTMLSEWNLNVREEGNFDSDGTDLGVPYSYTYSGSTIGYQDEHVRGYVDADSDSSLLPYTTSVTVPELDMSDAPVGYGIVRFDNSGRTSTNGYWAKTGVLNKGLNTAVYTACSTESYCETNTNASGYPAYVYDSNSSIKPFVDAYVNNLNLSVSGANAQGRLIDIGELIDLGCGFVNYSTDTCPLDKSWIYQTSYWAGSAKGTKGLSSSLYVLKAKYTTGPANPWVLTSAKYNSYDKYGIRPVILISSSVISLAS